MTGTSQYTRTAVALHWIIAAMIVAGASIGLYAADLAVSPAKLRLYSWHKWIGVTVLILAVARVTWRLRHAPPPLPPTMTSWESRVAASTHGLLYVLLFVVPLTGWLMSSAAGFPVVYFGVLPLPDLVAKNKELADSLKTVHFALNVTLFLLVLLHAAAALKHHVFDCDDVLVRMLPFLKPRVPGKET